MWALQRGDLHQACEPLCRELQSKYEQEKAKAGVWGGQFLKIGALLSFCLAGSRVSSEAVSHPKPRPLHGSPSAPLLQDGCGIVRASDDRLDALMRSGRVRRLCC